MDITQIKFPKIGKPTEDYVLHEDLFLEQWIVPKDTKVRIQQSHNFGWVFLSKGTQDKRGFEIPKRIFKY